jgi:hypothetical protein
MRCYTAELLLLLLLLLVVVVLLLLLCLMRLPLDILCIMCHQPKLCSYTAELLRQLGIQTLWSDKCIWISETVYNDQAYEDIPPNEAHACVPCWQTTIGCKNNTYYLPDGAYTYPTDYGLQPSSAAAGLRVSAFEDLVDIEVRVDRALAAGTLMIERYAGTFLLPSNKVSGGAGSCE